MPRRPKPPEPQRHRWFDQWMIARGEALKALVGDIIRVVAKHEAEIGAGVEPAHEVSPRLSTAAAMEAS